MALSRRSLLRGAGALTATGLLGACAVPPTTPASPVVTHRDVIVAGLRMHIAEAGTGPLVLLLHGWPESWYSWRHQLPALAAAGFHAVAPDQRGYGGTDRPSAIDEYSVVRLVDDVVGLIDALGADEAVVVGHDWGAIVAWHTALIRPDRVAAVAALSVPHRWAEPAGSAAPVETLRSTLGEDFYVVRFQQLGVADADLARDPRTTLRRILYNGSADGPGWDGRVPPGGLVGSLAEPAGPLDWLTERDLEVYVDDFAHSGFTGGLNWYRKIDLNWLQTAPWRDLPVRVPALYVVGERDGLLGTPQAQQLLQGATPLVPDLRRSLVVPGCGHWTQQEEPAAVTDALLGFLRSL
jgi:pimeloyl-ACP methyl ester carboxylesterase